MLASQQRLRYQSFLFCCDARLSYRIGAAACQTRSTSAASKRTINGITRSMAEHDRDKPSNLRADADEERTALMVLQYTRLKLRYRMTRSGLAAVDAAAGVASPGDLPQSPPITLGLRGHHQYEQDGNLHTRQHHLPAIGRHVRIQHIDALQLLATMKHVP
eukprot:COSAG01_NODE_10117_length_2256_cov_1.380819_2_plen_161_part_00